MKNYDFAKLAYDAYCKQTGGVSLVTGDRLPDFWSLKPEIRDAWWAAAEAVRLVVETIKQRFEDEVNRQGGRILELSEALADSWKAAEAALSVAASSADENVRETARGALDTLATIRARVSGFDGAVTGGSLLFTPEENAAAMERVAREQGRG